MGEIFRDQSWQFIGVVVAVFSLFYVIIVSKSKKLSYWLVVNTPLLSVDRQVEDKIEILYDGERITNLQLIIFSIVNSGNTPISKKDYDREISFSFGDNSKILSESIVETKPENLEISYEVKDGKIFFDRILLNKKDEFTVRLLIDNFSGEIKPDCRISGIKEMKLQTRKGYAFVFYGIKLSRLFKKEICC